MIWHSKGPTELEVCEELKIDLKQRFMASDERQINWNDSTVNITRSAVQLPVIAEPIADISYSNETQAVVKRSRRAIVFRFDILSKMNTSLDSLGKTDV